MIAYSTQEKAGSVLDSTDPAVIDIKEFAIRALARHGCSLHRRLARGLMNPVVP